MKTYIRIDPQPNHDEQMGWFGDEPWHVQYTAFGRNTRDFLCPHAPGSLLDGKRVLSVVVVKIADVSAEDAARAGYGWYIPAYVAGGEIVGPDALDPLEDLQAVWKGDYATDWAWEVETE